MASSSSLNWPDWAGMDTTAGHRIAWCEGGDPGGQPVLVLHGGPGGSSRLEPLRWFDGLPVRWIVFDQRGCGRSTPSGSTVANDLAALVADAEALRETLGIERWAIAGGSWGARVALACAAARPECTDGLFLRSPFLASPAEAVRFASRWRGWLGEAGLAWLGAERVAAFERLFLAGTTSLIGGASDAMGDDERLACAWAAYDDGQSQPAGSDEAASVFAVERLPAATPALRASWKVHAHYAATGWGGSGAAPGDPAHPADPAAWLERVAPAALAQRVPISIVWGEADATCDPAVAHALARHWPDAQARAVAGAGHRMGDARLGPALAQEARAWAERVLRSAAR